MPTIWILTAGRLGDFKQMQAIAHELGWPYEVKPLKFSSAWAPLVTNFPKWFLSGGSPDPFDEGEPDVVLCAEASAAALASAARRRKGSRFRLVCIGRPRGRLGSFDLILTSPQYRLAPAPNIVELPYPAVPNILSEGSDCREEVLEQELPSERPFTLVLVGGRSPPYRFDFEIGQALGKAIADRLHFTRGDAVVITSPRTGKQIEDALKSSLPKAATKYFWQDGQKTNIINLLKQADEAVVTCDSVSMTVEALQAGKPVLVYMLPETRGLGATLLDYLSRKSFAAPLFVLGLLETKPDRTRLYNLLSDKFALAPFSHDAKLLKRPAPESQTKAAASAISALFHKRTR
jgi:hypothetical protein